jgi:hypothetical protein
MWMMNGTDTPQKWDGAAAGTSAWAGTPPAGSMCRVWKNRMCVAGVTLTPQRLFFSDIGNPESPATAYGTNWVDIKGSEDDLDPITWLEVLGDNLFVFKRRSVWRVINPTTFDNDRVANVGCEDRFMSMELMGRLYWLNREGVYSLASRGGLAYESMNLQPYFQQTVNTAAFSRARMGVSRDRRLFVAVPTGSSTTNSRLLEGIPELQATRKDGTKRTPWIIHDLPVSSMAVFRIGSLDEIVAGDASAAKVHRLFTGLSDDGVAITSDYFSSWKGLITEEPFERIRRVNIEHDGKFVLELYQDLNSNVVKFSEVMEAPVDPDPLWDGGQWDGGQWDPISSTILERVRPERRGRYHALRFRNNELNKTWTIYGGEMALRGGKEH